MTVALSIAPEQHRLWNGPAGQAWVDAQDLLDRLFRPFEALLAEAVPASATRVLDVGCGTGASMLALARRSGVPIECVGIDISEPMIAHAQARAEREGLQAHFVCADAQDHRFEEASFDTIVSRFGVMFFDDPVLAFANLRRALKPTGHMRAIAWRSPGENPFMTTAERAAAPWLPGLPARRPDAPGQFAFADRERVQRILDASGWRDIDIRSVDVECVMRERDLMHYLTRLGPVGLALRETDACTRGRVVDAVRSGFEKYVFGDEVRFVAACWCIDARAAAPSAEDSGRA
ncbi:class I SAM-dependent methyltransferase [Lysobacter terrae]